MSAANEVHKSVDKSGAEVPESLRNGREHAGNYTRWLWLLGRGVLGLGGRLDVSAGTLALFFFSSTFNTALVGEAGRSNAECERVVVVKHEAVH
jgi:hypothetical protein